MAIPDQADVKAEHSLNRSAIERISLLDNRTLPFGKERALFQLIQKHQQARPEPDAVQCSFEPIKMKLRVGKKLRLSM